MSKSGSAGSSSQAKGVANSLKLGLAASQIRPNPATGFARSLFAVRGPSQWANLLRVVETVHRQHQPELFSSSVLGRHQNFQLDAGVVNRSFYVPRKPQPAPAASSDGDGDYGWSEDSSDTGEATNFPASAPSYLSEVIASPATSQEATPLQRASVRATYPAGMPTSEAANWSAPAMTVLNRQVAPENPAATPAPQQSQSDPFWNDWLPQEAPSVGNAPAQTSQWIEQLPALRHNPAVSPEVPSVVQQFQPVSETALNQSYLQPEYLQPRSANPQPVAPAAPAMELPWAVSMPAPFAANQEPAAASSNSAFPAETGTPVFTQPALVRAVARATNTAEQVETGYGQLPAQPTTAVAMSHLPLSRPAGNTEASSYTFDRQDTADYGYAASQVEANPVFGQPAAFSQPFEQTRSDISSPVLSQNNAASSSAANSQATYQSNVNAANPVLNRLAEPATSASETAQASGESVTALDRVAARATNASAEVAVPAAMDRVVARAANNIAETEPGYGQLPAQPATAMAMSHLPLARSIEQAKAPAVLENSSNNRAETATFADNFYNPTPASSQPANFEPATLNQPHAGEQPTIPTALDRVVARATNLTEQNEAVSGQTPSQPASSMVMSHLPLAHQTDTASFANSSDAAEWQASPAQAETTAGFTSPAATSSEAVYSPSQTANSSRPAEELAIPAALNRVVARAANAAEVSADQSPAALAMSHLPVNSRQSNNALATTQSASRFEEGRAGLDAATAQTEQGGFSPAQLNATEQALSRSALERASARANYYVNPEQTGATVATPVMSDLQRTAERGGLSQTPEVTYTQDNNSTYSAAPEVGSAQPASLAPAQIQEPRGTDLERWVAEMAARYAGTETMQPARGLYDEVGGGTAADFAAIQRSYYTVSPGAEMVGRTAMSNSSLEVARHSSSEFDGSAAYSPTELTSAPLSPLARVTSQLNQPTLVHALNHQSNAALGRAIERLNDESGIGAPPVQASLGTGPVEADVTLPDMTYSMPPLMAVQAAGSVDFPAPQTNDLLSLSLQSGLGLTSARSELSPEAESRINSAFEGLPSTGPISDSRFGDKRAGAWTDRLNALRYNPGKDMPSPEDMPAQALAALINTHLKPGGGATDAANRANGRQGTANNGELTHQIDPGFAGAGPVETGSNGGEVSRLAMTQLDTQSTARSNGENNDGTPSQFGLNPASGQLGQNLGVAEPMLGTSTAASFVQPMLQRHTTTGTAAAENTLNHPKPISVEKTGVKVADPDMLLRESQGRQLDSQVRAIMSDLLQANFDNVQVHDDSAAAKYADEIGAEAFTVGNSHIFFAAQRYQPHTPESMGLIAHELTHILQGASLTKLSGGAMPDVDHTGHEHELAAQETEQAVMRHLATSESSHSSGSSSSGSSTLQRSYMPSAPTMSHPDAKGITGKDALQRQVASETHSGDSTGTSSGHDNHNGGAGHDGKGHDGDAKKLDLNALAHDIYGLILHDLKRELQIERERNGLRDLFS